MPPTYTGISAPGASIFFIDGDFTQVSPCSLPTVGFPLKGDSIFSNRDVVQIYYGYPPGTVSAKSWQYVLVPLGSPGNLQPWSANQSAMTLEQDFMVAQAYYQPLRLNTQYNPAWAVGWTGTFPDGTPLHSLNQFYFVEEGPLEDCGGGIIKFRRKWATLPSTRNEVEQYAYNFPGFSDETTGATRQSFRLAVQSRVQYDYFIFDDWGVLSGVVNPFPNGALLTAALGLSPSGLIIPQFLVYQNAAGVNNGLVLDPPTLDDGPTPGTPTQTTTLPSFSSYLSVINGSATSNQLPGEICVENSVMTRYMGNIWERRTRFVIAQ